MRMSSGERYLNCPASYHAEQGLPETTSDAATSGTLIHEIAGRIIENDTLGGIDGNISDRELYIAKWLADEWNKLGCRSGIGEQEITITDSSGETKWTGHPDRYAMAPEKDSIILAEWKSGRNAVETAAGNVQLRLYAVALWQMYGRPVEARLMAYGNEEGERHTVVMLSKQQLEHAYNDAIVIWCKCQSDKAAFKTGSWCQYCRAEGTARCKASQDAVTALAVVPSQLPDDPAALAKLFEQAQTVQRICGKIQDYAKAYVIGGGTLPGYEMSKPIQKASVKDIVAAWEKCSGFVTQEQFLSCCKVTLGELQEALPKGTKVKDVLGSALEFTEVSGRLEKVKEKEVENE